MAISRPALYLVDGSGYVFRAFFGLPQLNNSRGLPTNAIYGFARMLLKLLKDAHPQRLAMVFDSPKKTFRDDLFDSYKANRVAPPSDLIVQIPFIHRLVEAFRIPSLIIEGYEADDVIGTLAVRAARQKIDCVIVTADKDFMQLVGPYISLWDTMRDKRTGVREVRQRFGVEPKALIDIMALMGDPIDNIKPIPGVGEKTAAALIQHFGSLDKLFANLDQLTGVEVRGAAKLAPLITQHRRDVELARKLVQINTDVPLQVEAEALVFDGIDHAATAALLRELEFNSLLAELTPHAVGMPTDSAAETEVSDEAATRIIGQLSTAKRLAMVATAQGTQLQALSLQAEGDHIAYRFSATQLAMLKPLLEAAQPPRVCHDLKAHLRLLRDSCTLNGVDFDTMLAGFLINPGRPEPSLDQLYHEHLAPLGGQAPGSQGDVLLALRNQMEQRLSQDDLATLFKEIELPLATVLAEMEAVGVGIDTGALRAMAVEFDAHLARLERECFAAAEREFNLNSPNQLREVLFTHLKLPTKGLKKTKSGYSTDVDVLTKLAELHTLPRLLLDYRALAKLKSTYIDSLPTLVDSRDGRLHTNYHQALTSTGRLSSTDPNLQNIPTRTEEGRRIRSAFLPRPGWLMLSADYSQIELRLLAHLSGDATLIDAFSRDEDIHVRTAQEILGAEPGQIDAETRRRAKIVNFGIIYGMGPQRLAGELAIPLREASEYIERYFNRLPAVNRYMEECLRQGRERGYVATMFGRRRYLPELNAPQGGARAQAERIAINTPIQGSAADLIKIAMVRLHRLLLDHRIAAHMLLQVHDELLFEVAPASFGQVSDLVRQQMEGVAELRVPLRVELKSGPNWAELKS